MMRSFLLALLLAVSHVGSVAEVQAVADEAAAGTGNAKTYQLVEQDQPTGGFGERLVGSPIRRGWLAITNAVESTVIPYRSAPDSPSALDPSPAAKADPGHTPVTINAGWVRDCPCGPDCVCVDETICKAGDCKKNFIVLFSADWCRHCPRQKSIIEQLKSEGYIAYIVDYNSHRDAADRLRVTTLPTTLVFDNGQEVARYVGVTQAKQVKAGVKKRSDQKDPENKPVYSFTE